MAAVSCLRSYFAAAVAGSWAGGTTAVAQAAAQVTPLASTKQAVLNSAKSRTEVTTTAAAVTRRNSESSSYSQAVSQVASFL